jgi:hypothetical protein
VQMSGLKKPSECINDLKTRRDVACWWFMWLVLAITWIALAGRAIRFTEIAKMYPVWDPVLISAPNLTYPHFCFRALEATGEFTNGINCVFRSGATSTPITGITTTPDQCGAVGQGQQCFCFNQYAYMNIGSDAPRMASSDVDSAIECNMQISAGSALMWVCDPNPDNSCGNPYGNPMSTNVAPIANGYHTFAGLIPAYFHNRNGTMNSTDYQITKSIRTSDIPGNTELVMSFTTFRVFHYFPIDEFSGFQWLFVSSMLAFFFMCIHRLAWLILKLTVFRSSTLVSGWGPVEAGSDDGTTKATAATPAPAPPAQPEGHKGYNSF